MTPETWANVAAGGQAIGSVTSGIGGLLTALGMNKTANENLAWQKEVYQKNWENQLAQQEYAKSLQQQIFAREDEAVRRRLADLKAAGMSPVLAAGSAAGAGSVVSVPSARKEAAQKGFQGQMAVMEAVARFADISKTIAETDLLASQASKARVEATAAPSIVDAAVREALAKASYAESQAARSWIAELKEKVSVEQWLEVQKDVESRGGLTEAQVEYATALAILELRETESNFASGSELTRILVPLLRLLK